MISRSVQLALIAVTVFGSGATASTERVLYSFPRGSYPAGQPHRYHGALYGTARDLSQVYQLKRQNGAWREQTIARVDNSPAAGVVIDRSAGILYGTTWLGGTGEAGTVYSVAPAKQGWTTSVLHNFSGGNDGGNPITQLLKDRATGDLYGTTAVGGTYDCGTAFQLSQSNGAWTFTTIYTFQGGSDACYPFTQLKHGRAGTLIGATGGQFGGDPGQIFQLKQVTGNWTDAVIYDFSGGTDGRYPTDLDVSRDGSIYGTTLVGGEYDCGVVFELRPTGTGYNYRVIYDFRGGSDGEAGYGITFDARTGNLYGTTFYGGGSANDGTLFKLSPNGNTWTETILHSFTGGTGDGVFPASRPIVDGTTGAIYGTTTFGGAYDGGTMYEVQP